MYDKIERKVSDSKLFLIIINDGQRQLKIMSAKIVSNQKISQRSSFLIKKVYD